MPNDDTPAAAPDSQSREDVDVLAAIGLRLDGPDIGQIEAACARIARRIVDEKLRIVGFVPSDDQVAVLPVAIHLGLALCRLTGATVAVVDANVRYPGLAEISRGPEMERASERWRAGPGSNEAAAGQPAARTNHETSVFATRWLKGSLALLSPPSVERAGEVVPQLARALLDGSDMFAHVLVDLTGFELLGEHASAAACMDGVALIGRAHRTRERELVELASLMPHGRFMGVLLVG